MRETAERPTRGQGQSWKTLKPLPTEAMVAVGRESEVQGLEQRRILSSTLGSDSFGKFSTLLDSSTAYKNANLSRYDPLWRVLNMELLQFYYSASSDEGSR